MFPSLFKLRPVSIYADLEGDVPTYTQSYLVCPYMYYIICVCVNMSYMLAFKKNAAFPKHLIIMENLQFKV